MKRTKLVILLLFFTYSLLHAQISDILTNSTIVKMVKAKLSDELIIEEINNSNVNFNLGIDSIKYLINENISSDIIKAMQAASNKQNKTEVKPSQNLTPEITPTAPIQKTEPPGNAAVPTQHIAPPGDTTAPVQKPSSTQNNTVSLKSITNGKDSITRSETTVKDTNARGMGISTQNPPVVKTENIKPVEQKPQETASESIQKSLNETNKQNVVNSSETKSEIITITGISYVKPLTDLVLFLDSRYEILTGMIQQWNKQIADSLEKEKMAIEKTKTAEKELMMRIDEDCLPFNDKTLNLQKKAADYRNDYALLRNNILNYGSLMGSILDNISGTTIVSLGDKFEEVSKAIKKTEPDLSVPESLESKTLSMLNFNDKLSFHLIPVKMVLSCYKHQINYLQNEIENWNKKAKAIIEQDSLLRVQVDPLKTKLIEYQQNSKIYKLEIASMKKHIFKIEEQRKALVVQMKQDSKELSESLNELEKKFQFSIKERFDEARDKVQDTFRDNF